MKRALKWVFLTPATHPKETYKRFLLFVFPVVLMIADFFWLGFFLLLWIAWKGFILDVI